MTALAPDATRAHPASQQRRWVNRPVRHCLNLPAFGEALLPRSAIRCCLEASLRAETQSRTSRRCPAGSSRSSSSGSLPRTLGATSEYVRSQALGSGRALLLGLLPRSPPHSPPHAPHHHHPAASCAPAALPAHWPPLCPPRPQPQRENASSWQEHTIPPPTVRRTTAPAGAGMMAGAFGVQNSGVAHLGWRGRGGRARRAAP
jgi:hypothetical protein